MNITKEGAATVPGLCCIFSRATGRCGWHRLLLEKFHSGDSIQQESNWRSRAGDSHLFIVVVLAVVQEVNGADPVHGFVVPRVVRHVVHQALQPSAAGEIIRA